MCLQGVTIQNDPPPTPQTQSHRHRKPKQINNETITTISKRNKVVGKTVLCEKGEEPHHNLCFLRKKKKKNNLNIHSAWYFQGRCLISINKETS